MWPGSWGMLAGYRQQVREPHYWKIIENFNGHFLVCKLLATSQGGGPSAAAHPKSSFYSRPSGTLLKTSTKQKKG